MAESKLIVEIDATLINKAFKSGIELGYMIAMDGKFQEIYQQLNLNKIDEPDTTTED